MTCSHLQLQKCPFPLCTFEVKSPTLLIGYFTHAPSIPSGHATLQTSIYTNPLKFSTLKISSSLVHHLENVPSLSTQPIPKNKFPFLPWIISPTSTGPATVMTSPIISSRKDRSQRAPKSRPCIAAAPTTLPQWIPSMGKSKCLAGEHQLLVFFC